MGILTRSSEDALGKLIKVSEKEEIEDYEGPLINNLHPTMGNLDEINVKNIKYCAAKCYLHSKCRGFFFSRTAAADGDGKNCKLDSRKHPRTGIPAKDFKMYL